jgi:hypothetical protein
MLIKSQSVQGETALMFSSEILFDKESVTLFARYHDELSAHRAKRVWVETFESHFLLEADGDYRLEVARDESEIEVFFVLRCRFISACARYAFWRITNQQAPEAQYVLETAHIPFTEESWLDFHVSSDLREFVSEEEFVVKESPLSIDLENKSVRVNRKWFQTFEAMVDKIVKSFDSGK